MKQSAVEWYSEEHWKLFIQLENKEITTIEYALEHQIILDQAKEMEKQQKDEFSIEFAKWCAELKVWDNETYVNSTFEQLLEIFKNK